MKRRNKSTNRRRAGCLSVLALFLLTLLVVAGWFYNVVREVEVHDEDLVLPFENVLDEENGFSALGDLAIRVSEQMLDAIRITNSIPTAANLLVAQQFIEAHPNVLETFYATADYSYCQARYDDSIPLRFTDGLHLAGVMLLGELSLCHIENSLQVGRTAEALDCLQAHLRIGQMINAGTHELIGGSVGLLLNDIAKDLLMAHLSQGTLKDADCARLQAMMFDLETGNDWSRMFRAEYCSAVSVVQSLGEDVQALSFGSNLFYNESKLKKRFADYCRETIESIDHADRHPIQKAYAREDSAVQSVRDFVCGETVIRYLFNLVMPKLHLEVSQIYSSCMKDDLLELYLALWCYEQEHRALPERLEFLVPDYLSAVPTDPRSGEERFIYERDLHVIRTGENVTDPLSMTLGFVESESSE